MPLPNATITLDPYRMKNNPDRIVAVAISKNNEDMGYLSYDRVYEVYSYSELLRLSNSAEGPISAQALNEAYEGSNYIVDTTLPFIKEPFLPPIKIHVSPFYTYKIEVATEVKSHPTWEFA